MIIRSLTQKAPKASFANTVNYLLKRHREGENIPLHKWNLRADPEDHAAVITELEDNYEQFSRKRKGHVVLFHEILSPHKKDGDKVTVEQLDHFAQSYLERRAPNALGCWRIHQEKDSLHVHIVLCGNEIASDKQLRLTRSQFTHLQKNMEEIQKQTMPGLKHSLVFDDEQNILRQREKRKYRQERTRRRQREYDRARRLADMKEKPLSKKERITQLVDAAIRESKSQAEFEEKLKAERLEFTWRSARTMKTPLIRDLDDPKMRTLKNGEKSAAPRVYRLKTLKADQAFSQQCETWHDYLTERQQLRLKEREREKLKQKQKHRQVPPLE